MRETGWQPVMNFETGLARTIEWYRDNAAWVARVRSGEYRTYYERNYGNRTGRVVAANPMRVAIEAASLSLSSGGLARYTSELSLALARCFPGRRILPGLRPALPHAVARAGQSEVRRRPAQFHGAPLVALGTGARVGAARRGPGARSRFRRALSSPAAQRAHPARSLAVDGRTLASRRPSRPPAHAGAARTGSGDHGDHSRREGAAGGHRALRPASGARGGGAGGRGPLVPSGGDRRPAPPYFLFVGTLEPRKNLETLLEAWREVRRHHAVDLVLAGRRRADAPEIRPEPGLRLAGEVAGLPNCRRCIRARWRSSTRRSTKASDCRCWKPCSAARR